MADNNQYDSLIKKYADMYNVPFDLAKGVMMKESGGDPNAVSPTGPVGLYQLSKAASIDAGLHPDQRTDPESNIKAGLRTLSQRYKDSGGDWGVALGSYNQGAAGFNSQMKSGNYKPEVVNYVNDPRFSPWINDSRVKGIANPVGKLQKQNNQFTPDQLSRGALKNATTQAEAEANSASMQPTQSVVDETPSNSLLQTQQQYNNALQSQQIEQDAAKRATKQKGYQDLTYMVLGTILGRNANKVKTAQTINTNIRAPEMQSFGNQSLYNFQAANKGG